MRTILVCGGREYADRDAVFAALDSVHAQAPIDLILHGACCVRGRKTNLRGADRWGQEWAQEREVPYLGVPARWTLLGKAAGYERNGRMLVFRPVGVVAFPGGPGTANMVRQAKAAGIDVWIPYGEVAR